jgi:hypothetical protein
MGCKANAVAGEIAALQPILLLGRLTMPILTWKHGHTRDQVRNLLIGRIATAGVTESVTWRGDTFLSSIGWGAILNLEGHITDDTITLEKASGVLGSTVLAKSKQAFQELFPGGDLSSQETLQRSAV